LNAVVSPIVGVPVEETFGSREARGATVGTTQVHSLRLPSFSVSTEIVFGGEDERLSIATMPDQRQHRTSRAHASCDPRRPRTRRRDDGPRPALLT
jgi:dihydrodipicolinate reductase